MEYGRDADGHQIREYPRMRAIAARSVNRRDVVPDRLLAIVVLVQSGDEDLYRTQYIKVPFQSILLVTAYQLVIITESTLV